MMRHHKRKAPRRHRRARVGPKASLASKLTLKSYKYNFQLSSQCVANVPGVAGVVQLAEVEASVPNRPIYSSYAGPAPFSPIDNCVVKPGTCGLSGFYDLSGAVTFRLSDCQNASTFAAMYDAYRFGKVSLNFEYLNNFSSVSTGGLMPTVYMYWDQDDATNPPSLTSISRKQGVRRTQIGNKGKTAVRWSCIPTTSQVLGSAAGLAPAGVNTKRQWINCTTTNVDHYALKFYITDVYLPTSDGVTQAFRFNWTYNIEFRSPLLTA